MKQLLRLSVLAVAWALLSPAPAAAAEPTTAPAGAAPSAADRNTARRLATEAQKALKAGDFEKAADHFQRANELVKAPTLQLGLARARVGQGRLLEGYEIYDGIVRAGVAPDASKAFKKALVDAKAESAALEARLAWVTVSVRGADPAETTVKLNDQLLPTAALGVERPVNPGTIHARAEAPGYRMAEAQVQLSEGERGPTIELTLVEIPKAEAEPLVAQDTVMRTDGGAERDQTLQTLGYVGLGVGGAALAVGAVAGIIAYNRHAELVDCADNPDSCNGGYERAREMTDDYHKFATIANIGVITGGVLAATGLVLILTAPEEQAPTTAHITPYIGPGSIGAVGTF
jgi:hypothetical protein